MIRVHSVYSLRVKFNIGLSFSEMRRLYWIKFINVYTQGQKESGKVPERNFENFNLMRQILVVYLWQNIFTYASNFEFMKFGLGQLKLVSTDFLVLKSSYFQSPCFVLHLHPKCITDWSFNSELHTAFKKK